MAIAHLSGGPLDGQTVPLDDENEDRLILPYAETQLVYSRVGHLEQTGDDDGPTLARFAFEENEDDLIQNGDQSSYFG